MATNGNKIHPKLFAKPDVSPLIGTEVVPFLLLQRLSVILRESVRRSQTKTAEKSSAIPQQDLQSGAGSRGAEICAKEQQKDSGRPTNQGENARRHCDSG